MFDKRNLNRRTALLSLTLVTTATWTVPAMRSSHGGAFTALSTRDLYQIKNQNMYFALPGTCFTGSFTVHERASTQLYPGPKSPNPSPTPNPG